MSFRLTLAALLLAALPVSAETILEEIARSGLAATEARLAAVSEATEDQRLALGAVQFLRAVEGSFPTCWAYGLSDRTGFLPLLHLPLGGNPAPQPFDPSVLARIFSDAEEGLARAFGTFSTLPDVSVASLDLALGDICLDVDANGLRAPGEGLAEPVARIVSACASLAELGPIPPGILTGMEGGLDAIDILAIVLAMLAQNRRRVSARDRGALAGGPGGCRGLVARGKACPVLAFWHPWRGELAHGLS